MAFSEDPKIAKAQAPLSPAGWPPKIPRQVWSMGLGGLVAWAGQAAIAGEFHFDLGAWLQPWIAAIWPFFFAGPPPSSQGALALIIGGFIGWVVPASYRDIYSRINALVVARAVTDPTSPVKLESIVNAVADSTPHPPPAGS